jgi:hypothetical protein
MATNPESLFRPHTHNPSETLTTCGILLLLAGGLIWAYLTSKEPTTTRLEPSRAELVESRPNPAKSNSPAAQKDLTTTESVEQQDRSERPEGVPHVRLSNTSDAEGFLRGTVHNDTGRPIERLRLRITTAKWADRTFDVKVKVENNATAPFSFFVGEPDLRVESFRTLAPNG